MEGKTDRRIVKTKENIRKCFIELAQTRQVEKITVKEICERARCSRNTFYQHYPYKEALYKEIVDGASQRIMDAFIAPKGKPFGNWIVSPSDFLRGALNAISQVRGILALMPPGSEMYNGFIVSLTHLLAESMHAVRAAMTGMTDARMLELDLIGERSIAAVLLNFGMYWITETEYSLDEAVALISPQFTALYRTVEEQTVPLKGKSSEIV